jgi:hypothetical protein
LDAVPLNCVNNTHPHGHSRSILQPRQSLVHLPSAGRPHGLLLFSRADNIFPVYANGRQALPTGYHPPPFDLHNVASPTPHAHRLEVSRILQYTVLAVHRWVLRSQRRRCLMFSAARGILTFDVASGRRWPVVGRRVGRGRPGKVPRVYGPVGARLPVVLHHGENPLERINVPTVCSCLWAARSPTPFRVSPLQRKGPPNFETATTDVSHSNSLRPTSDAADPLRQSSYVPSVRHACNDTLINVCFCGCVWLVVLVRGACDSRVELQRSLPPEKSAESTTARL